MDQSFCQAQPLGNPAAVGAIRFALGAPALSGPVNAVAPHETRCKDFTHTLGRVLGRPAFVPAPAAAVKLALGEMADALLLASTRVRPRALLEAMASGLPVVATNIRGCREEVVSGETGILVPPGDHAALAGAIARLLRSRTLMSSMGTAGRKRVLEHFDERRIIDRQIDCLRALSRAKLQK